MNRIVLLLGCLVSTVPLTACEPEELFEPPERQMVWSKDRLPLQVQIDAQISDYRGPISYAVNDLNDRVGCDLLVLQMRDAATFDVLVRLGANNEASEDQNGEAVAIGLAHRLRVRRSGSMGSRVKRLPT